MSTSAQHPDQTLGYPGFEHEMAEQPADMMEDYQGSGLLTGRVALITGGDSGIGRAVAVAFAKEGADVVIGYLSEHTDAEQTIDLVEAAGGVGLAIAGDLTDPAHRSLLVSSAATEFGGIDVLVNNAAFQSPVERIDDLDLAQWRRTFTVNVESMFFVTQAALAYMPEGGSIINTASVTGYRGHRQLIDYAATKGAVLALTQSLAAALVERRIRVNAVAPGPVWTPLIPATFDPEKVAGFGADTPFGRAAQPDEIAPSYVFLASNTMSSYYSGEVLAPVGGPALPR